jgi:REP element-mobilizing transposase RayT
MGHDLRYVPPRSLVEVTNRTIQERFLLRPSGELKTLIDGIIGRAQRLYRLDIVAYVFLSNHFHLLAVPDDAQQLARFMGYVEGNIAKEAGRLHDWRGKFWARRYRPIIVGDEPELQIARLRYILAQGVKEGLVSSPGQWPGASSTRALMHGDSLEGLWFDRTQEYEARRCGEEFPKLHFATPETVVLSPLPCWQNQPEHRIQARVRGLVREIEAEAVERERTTGRPPLGVQAIYRQHPHDRAAHPKRSPAPRFHASSREERRSMERAYRRFYWAYRDAAEKLRAGVLGVSFPPTDKTVEPLSGGRRSATPCP